MKEVLTAKKMRIKIEIKLFSLAFLFKINFHLLWKLVVQSVFFSLQLNKYGIFSRIDVSKTVDWFPMDWVLDSKGDNSL